MTRTAAARRPMPGAPSRPGPALGHSTAGFTLLELLIAASIISVAMMVMAAQIVTSYRESEETAVRAFAEDRASAMLTELQFAIERGDLTRTDALDALDDGGAWNPVLTLLCTADGASPAPDHAASGNVRSGDGWLWMRSLSVEQVPAQDHLRLVSLTLARRQGGGLAPQATVGSVFALPERASPPVRVYDVYVIACPEVPSLAGSLSEARERVTRAALDITSSNPGIELRLHWITQLGYGREESYVPFVNTEHDATHPSGWLYAYPGSVAALGRRLFDADAFTARLRTETGILNAFDPTTNPAPYSIADATNHCMREPMARRRFAQRVAAGVADADEPPLQLFLADLAAESLRHANSILVNLHGEVLPCPPLRNYSDAARRPLELPGIRAVTHPARLWTPCDPDADGHHADSRPLELRVHAYRTDPATGPAVVPGAIVVDVVGLDLTANVNGADSSAPASLEIRRLPGGVDVSTGSDTIGNREYHGFDTELGVAPHVEDRTAPFEMAWSVERLPGEAVVTRIRLFGTPATAPPFGQCGLSPLAWLEGLEHIPSPVGGVAFDPDLATASDAPIPRNTARWRLRIPASVAAQRASDAVEEPVEIRTWLEPAPGAAEGAPGARVSTTWAWWCASPESVPVVERSQFLGDPRWNPYLDLMDGEAAFAGGYNRWHKDIAAREPAAGGSWPGLGLDRMAEGFGAGSVRADVPRLFALWRTALAASESVLVQLGPGVASVVGLGGEVAAPRETPVALPGPVAVSGLRFGAKGSVVRDGVTWPRPGGTIAGATVATCGTWYARPWLGELCPDDRALEFASDGNLRLTGPGSVGSGAVACLVPMDELPEHVGGPLGGGADVGILGLSTLLATGEHGAAPALHYAETTWSQALVPGADAPFRACGVDLPPSDVLLPIGLDLELPLDPPHEAQADVYGTEGFTVQVLAHRYAFEDRHHGAAVLRMLAGDETRGYLSYDGALDARSDDAFERLLIGALDAVRIVDEPQFGNDFPDVPRVEFTAPLPGTVLDSPSYVALEWRARRQPLGDEATPEPRESGLLYALLMSADDGRTWALLPRKVAWTPGERPSDGDLLVDSGPGDESFLLELPAEHFPAGEYRLRVECWRASRAAHHAYHELRLQIRR